jgi:hypothetical protein
MKPCEGYSLGTLPGARFCDKHTARTMQNALDLFTFRGSLLCAFAFEHGQRALELARARDSDSSSTAFVLCGDLSGVRDCVICNAVLADPGRP